MKRKALEKMNTSIVSTSEPNWNENEGLMD